MPSDAGLLGVVLAGGLGRRLGGAKAGAELLGRPLAAWVAGALREAASEVVLTAKDGVSLPPLAGVAVWREPPEPVHPLAGVAWALERARSRDVLVCPVDLPFCAGAVRAVAAAARADGRSGSDAGSRVVVAEGQPLLGIYRGWVAGALRSAVEQGRSARTVVASLGALAVTVPEPERTLFNVNTPEDLARAEVMAGRG